MSLPLPRSPRETVQRDPDDQPTGRVRHVGFALREWKLQRIALPPLRLTRPPRTTLTKWDIRVRRYTSPRESWDIPPLLSPLPPSPNPQTNRREAGTQTLPPSRVTRGTQASTSSEDRGTDAEWETTSVGSQTDSPSEFERSHTPPGTPPAWRRAGRARSAPFVGQTRKPEQYGPVRWTRTQPSISWRERLSRPS